MAYQAIFSTKKKPQYQASGMTSQYAENPTSKQPTAKFGASVMSGNGISSIQNAVFPKLSFSKPSASVSSQPSSSQTNSSRPNSSQPIQASGMSSKYAGNPSNYVAPQPPKPEIKIEKPQDPFNSRLNDVMNTAKDQQSFAETARKQQEDYIRQQYELSNRQLQEQLPAAQSQFGEFKKNTEASIADLLASGERQKANATDYYGDAQRQAAQSRRQVQGKTQQTFANLGTLDSRGEGSFQQATENQDSEFNRFTQQNLRAQADKLTEIDSAIGQAERSARATITQEEAKMNELARSIQYAMANNNLQQARELTDAYNTSKQYIYEIQDSVSQMKYQFGLEQEKLASEMAKVQLFSPEFMAGGPPTNQAEYEFFIKNQKDIQSANGSNGNTASNQKASNIITQLLNTGTQGITGKVRFGFSDESRSAEGLLKQLSSELQIEEAKRLKGQGAMSDSERAILANSIAAFNLDKNGRPNVSNERFRSILEELQAGFNGGQQSQTIRVRENATGQTGSIPANEFDPSIYTQI